MYSFFRQAKFLVIILTFSGNQNYTNLMRKYPKKRMQSMVLFITVPPVWMLTLIFVYYKLFIRHGYCGWVKNGTAYFWSVQPCSNWAIRMNDPICFFSFWIAWVVPNSAGYAVPFEKNVCETSLSVYVCLYADAPVLMRIPSRDNSTHWNKKKNLRNKSCLLQNWRVYGPTKQLKFCYIQFILQSYN